MIKIIVGGNRNFDNQELFDLFMERLLPDDKTIFEIISGHCEGADTMGEKYANEHGIPLKIFPPDWNQYGKAAGPIRNKQMAEYAADGIGVLIVFWDGKSRGTKNMIEQAFDYGLDVHVMHWKRE